MAFTPGPKISATPGKNTYTKQKMNATVSHVIIGDDSELLESGSNAGSVAKLSQHEK